MSITKNPVISIANLTKKYGTFTAVENVSFNIHEGEIFGLIGPNGAGKTTAILCLLGLLDVEPGSKLSILNMPVPVQIDQIYTQIGYMPQDLSLYMDLSVEQNLRFFGKLYGLQISRLKQRINEILQLVDLVKFRDRVLSQCSGGMQRRTSLAVALLHEPKVLILDEPTVGVDPELRITFWDYFKQISKEKQTSILITTHYLAESLKCDQVALVQKTLVIQGSPIELQEKVQAILHTPTLPDMEEVFIHYTKQSRIQHATSAGNAGSISAVRGSK